MKRRRVKITGIGPVTPAGIGREEFWKGILEPQSRVTLLKRFPEEGGPMVGAEVRDFRFENIVPGISMKRMPRHTQFAVAAAELALKDAGLQRSDLRGKLPVVIVGASLMDFGAINKLVDLVVKKGPTAGASPATVFTTSVSSISGTIGELIGGTTRTLALQSACCAGLDAIGHAAEAIARGETDIAICGGTEAPLHLHPMLELKLAGLAPGNPENPHLQCRPFDMWRTTGVIGEGAAMLVLEPEESPRRGYAYLEGYAYATDPVGEVGVGFSEAMRLCVANAGCSPSDVEAVSAWGPGHQVIDRAEAEALVRCFGARLQSIPTVSLKGAIGNPLGAAGAIQAACAALCLQDGVIPPTVNWRYADPCCPLNLSANCRRLPHTTALVNAHGLSGTNSCLFLRR